MVSCGPVNLVDYSTYFVDRFHDPIYTSIATYSLVLRIYQDDLEVLVGRILVDPVRVQYAEVGTTAADAFLGS